MNDPQPPTPKALIPVLGAALLLSTVGTRSPRPSCTGGLCALSGPALACPSPSPLIIPSSSPTTPPTHSAPPVVLP
jgi:hypothetical protein